MQITQLFELIESNTRQHAILMEEAKASNINWRHFVEHGLFVTAIRLYREEHTGMSLREAKDAVDSYREMMNSN